MAQHNRGIYIIGLCGHWDHYRATPEMWSVADGRRTGKMNAPSAEKRDTMAHMHRLATDSTAQFQRTRKEIPELRDA